MLKRVLRAGLGVIFLFVFLMFLLIGAVRFRLLNPGFWKTALEKGMVYEQLQGQIEGILSESREGVRKQGGPAGMSEEMLRLLYLDKELTADRFRELIETNVDRLLGYVNGKDGELVLFLPVKEWNLPVAVLGQPGLASLTGETPIEAALGVFGMKQEQAEQVMAGVGQLKGLGGILTIVLVILFLLTAGILAGHYFLGEGLVDRIGGTAWLLVITGFAAKLIGVGAGGIFEVVARNSRPPMALWLVELGQSLVGQFFNLGATIGLLVGLVGLAGIAAGIYLSKKGKAKEEKVKMSLIKRIVAFVLGVMVGLVVLATVSALLVVAFGGKVDFKFGGGPVGVDSQTGARGGTTGAVEEGAPRLTDDYYRSDRGWRIKFPVGWEVMKDENSEGVIKKPVGSATNWAAIEVKTAKRFPEVDSGGYLSGMKYVLEAGKTSLDKAVFFEEPYEEVQETGWRRFVFPIDYDDVFGGQKMRVRLFRVEFYPPGSGDGFLVIARVPLESWGKYEKIIKESIDWFKMGD